MNTHKFVFSLLLLAVLAVVIGGCCRDSLTRSRRDDPYFRYQLTLDSVNCAGSGVINIEEINLFFSQNVDTNRIFANADNVYFSQDTNCTALIFSTSSFLEKDYFLDTMFVGLRYPSGRSDTLRYRFSFEHGRCYENIDVVSHTFNGKPFQGNPLKIRY